MKPAVRASVVIGVLWLGCPPAEGASADAPEAAVEDFEKAYLRGDAEAAAAAWDFQESSELFGETMFPPFVRPNFLSSNAKNFEHDLRDEIRNKVIARFGVSQCAVTRKEQVSRALIRLVETCRWPDGFESSEELLTFKSSGGWRLVQFPTIRVFEPVCFSGDWQGTRVCSERDGSQVTAVQNGRQLWRKDAHGDWKVWPYRTVYPVVRSMTAVPEGYRKAYGRLIPEHAIFIQFDSSQFGVVDEEAGKFTMLGQN
jgi:hypothetical protein